MSATETPSGRSGFSLGDAGRSQRRRGTVLRWAVTIGMLLLLATQVDFGVMARIFSTLHWGYVTLAIALILGDRILVTLRWWLLLRARRVSIGFWELTVLHLTANFIGSFLPTSFSVDAVRIVLLVRRTGRAMDCTAASIMDRLLMLAGTLLVASVAAIALSAALPVAGMGWIIPLLSAAMLLMMGLMFLPGFWRPAGRISRRVLGDRATTSLTRFYWAMHSFRRHHATIAVASMLTFLALLLRVLIVLSLGLSLGAEPGFFEYLLSIPLAWLAVMLPISVGGFGLQEGVYVATLAIIGISTTMAVSISLLDQIAVRFVALLGALVWMVKPTGRRSAERGGLMPIVAANERV